MRGARMPCELNDAKVGISLLVSLVLAPPFLEARAQSTAVIRSTTTVSRARVDAVLGPSRTTVSDIRVVRRSGATEVTRGAASVQLAPGDFVFRKSSDSARRVVAPTAAAPGAAPVPRLPPGAKIYRIPYRVL